MKPRPRRPSASPCPALHRVLVLLLALAADGARAVPVYKDTEVLDPDRPEAWASFHYTSVTLLSGLSLPRAREPGEVSIGFEAGRIPQLSENERTVGFNGLKEEDLNKAPLFARPRLSVGLPWDTTLILSYLPPVRVWGLKPSLYAVAIERPVLARGPWQLGARLYAQTGVVQGAFTCSDEVAESPPGSPGNPYGCEQQSTDRAYQRYVGLEASLARSIAAVPGLQLYGTLALNHLDTTVKVHAQTFGFADRSRLDADDDTISGQLGFVYALDERLELGVGVFYTPLEVRRYPWDSTSNDPLVNLRAMLSYRL